MNWWKPKQGNSSFWFENWTGLGALYFTLPDGLIEEEAEVTSYVLHGVWKIEKLNENLPEVTVQHIRDNINPPMLEEGNDTPIWTIDHSGVHWNI